MNDIVERLREHAATSSYLTECRPRGLIYEAADEIERLRAELREWQEEPFGGLVRAGVLFMSPERVEEATARARCEGIEAAAHAAENCLHPSAERTAHAAVEDAVAAIRALLTEGGR